VLEQSHLAPAPSDRPNADGWGISKRNMLCGRTIPTSPSQVRVAGSLAGAFDVDGHDGIEPWVRPPNVIETNLDGFHRAEKPGANRLGHAAGCPVGVADCH
jgi:hypothetical protein